MEAQKPVARRLAAIIAADVAGYSRLTQADEEGTLTRLRALRRDLFLPKIAAHRGRVVKTSGDGILIEFASVVDAVRLAIEVQRALAAQNVDVPPDRRIELRIGINLGDVVVEEDGDLMGDGVNVAARLEALAEPGGICISETVLNHVRDKISFAVEDAGNQVLKNIARPIHVYRILVDPGQRRVVPRSQGGLALPDKPSIAVLPFQNMSGDPEQDYFADGIVEEIITALSRIRWLFVIARNSSFTYKGRAVDVKQVGRELGVRYVLEGSVRKAGNRMRITGQLIDALSGAHLWADRFDGSMDEVFDLQDSVALSVAGVIEPTLEVAEIHRSALRPTADLSAYDLYLRARAANQSWDKESVLRALDLLRQALERDPHYASALALAATCHNLVHANGWSEDQERTRQQGVDYARRALRVAGDDPYVLEETAFTLGYFERDINPALVLIDRSLELNPSFAIGWLRSGWLRLWSGQYDLAIEHCEKSLRLNPRRKAPASMAIGVGHFFARRFEKSTAALMLSLQENPSWPPTYRFLASCFAHMGRLREAQDIVKRLREITPLLIPSAEHWRVAEDREFYLAGLRAAVGDATQPT